MAERPTTPASVPAPAPAPADSHYVTDVMRSLWPHPSVVRFGGWRQGTLSERAEEWLVLPSKSKPMWLLPANRRDAAKALLRHDPGQRHARTLTVLALLQSRGLLRRLPLARVLVEVRSPETTVAAHLTRMLGQQVAVCVRFGRRRWNRTLVLQVLGDSGRTCAFVKMTTDPSAVETLDREGATLRRAADLLRGSRVQCPELLWRGTWREYTMLAMSALVPTVASAGDPDSPASIPVTHMLELALSVRAPGMEVIQANYTARQSRSIDQLSTSTDALVLRQAHTFLLEQYGEVSLEVGAWHGDWVPWNMAWSGENVLLWDWEHFAEDVPIGWDLVHYRAQQLRIGVGTGAAEEDRWLAETPSLLERELGLDARSSFALMLSYLIEVNIRYVADRAAETQIMPPRAGWGLPLLTRLTDGLRHDTA